MLLACTTSYGPISNWKVTFPRACSPKICTILQVASCFDELMTDAWSIVDADQEENAVFEQVGFVPKDKEPGALCTAHTNIVDAYGCSTVVLVFLEWCWTATLNRQLVSTLPFPSRCCPLQPLRSQRPRLVLPCSALMAPLSEWARPVQAAKQQEQQEQYDCW